MFGRGFRVWAVAVLALMLAACVPALGPAKKASGSNPVTGSEIEVTALDDGPVAKGKPKGVAPVAPAPGAKAPPPDATRPKARPGSDAGVEGEVKAEGEGKAEAVAPPKPAETVPEAEKSASQIACEKKKGVWAEAENGLYGCVTNTRDGGKQCTRAGQCEGSCLARSGTCAPFKPLFGCNEIFDESGRRMTLCLN